MSAEARTLGRDFLAAPAALRARLPAAVRTPLVAAGLFAAFSSAFFLAIGAPPGALVSALFEGAFGSVFALSETLVKAAPIVLCALATALPLRLGLISVGAEGQLAAGAISGAAFVLTFGDRLGAATLPGLLLSAAAGGAAYGALAGLLRARWNVNETISTLLLNYLSPLLVSYLVYGPWKDPASLGWPATAEFPAAARLPAFFDTRVHFGLVLGVAAVLAAHAVFSRSRTGLALDLLRSSPQLAERAGLSFAANAIATFAIGGACAGIAGIAEAAVLEGRLQEGVGAGAGYSGFLVAFLAAGRVLPILPIALIVASLSAAGDNLQLSAGLPSSIVFVLQGLLFAAALIAYGARRHTDSVAEVS